MRAVFDHTKPSRAVNESHINAIDKWLDIRQRHVELICRGDRVSRREAQGDDLTCGKEGDDSYGVIRSSEVRRLARNQAVVDNCSIWWCRKSVLCLRSLEMF